MQKTPPGFNGQPLKPSTTDVGHFYLPLMFEPMIRVLQAWEFVPTDASDEEVTEKAVNWIFGLTIGIILIASGGVAFIVKQIEKRDEQEIVVSWTIKHVVDVQATIERLALEINQRNSKLSDLQEECRKLDINWEKDPTYLRWEHEVLELTKERESLIQTRNGAYLENYKAVLDSDLEYESPPRKMALHAMREAHRVSQVIQGYRVPSSPRLEPAPPGLGPQISSSESQPTSSAP